MVAPSTVSKESSPPVDPNSPENQKSKEGDKGIPYRGKSAPTAVSIPVHISFQRKAKKFIGKEIIMNPVVLSIISHFPNKLYKTSEKYVVNGLTVPPSVPDPKCNQDQQQPSAKNVNSSQSKSNTKSRPSAKLKRYAGLLLAILSSMMFSFTGLIVKIINHHHPLTQATWMFIATVIVALPMNICRYLYVYKLSKESRKEESQSEKKSSLSSSGSFKSFPDNIEHTKVLENLSEKEQLAIQNLAGNGEVSTEKLQAGLPTISSTVASAVVEIINNNNNVPGTAAKRRQEERWRKIKLLMLLLVRACSGCSGMILYFYSLKYLNVGDSLVIVCSSPIFVFIIGYLFLGESCGVIPVLTIVLSMIGVGVITRPPMLTGKETFQTEEIIGAGIAFSSMLCIATTIILMRFLQNVYHGLINLVFGIWGSIQTTLLALAVGVLECPRDGQDALLMGATGVLFFLGQTFLAVALQFEEAGPVSLVRTSEVVFAFVWQFIFLKVSPDCFSISGAGLILSGILLTISRKWVAAMPENSKSRKLFGFLLR